MAILDCESLDSALNSICTIYGVSRKDVIEFLHGIDIDEEYKSKKIYETADDHLQNLFESNFGQPLEQIEKVYWFHLTRVTSNTDFSDGILPLHEVLSSIWDTMCSILDNKEQKSRLLYLKETEVPDFQYNLKTNDTLHSGPYAMLVKESAINSKIICNHDYLEVPEIIEDICNGYYDAYSEGIYSTILKSLRKCIVKFESTKYVEPYLLAPALLYCWCKINSTDFHSFANTCYDSEGKRIPKDKIISIDFI